MRGQRWVNLLVRGLLRTPGFCRIIGNRLVTVHVVGRKSGRRYSVPVAYVRQGDDLLIGTSFAWGRNLRTGDTVAMKFKGKLLQADVRAFTKEADVVLAYAHMARVNPAFARFTNVRLVAEGEPDSHDLHLAWRGGARAIRLTPQRLT
jgi:deazaflavin-dependent oxidoreductase (nitroreductase family)